MAWISKDWNVRIPEGRHCTLTSILPPSGIWTLFWRETCLLWEQFRRVKFQKNASSPLTRFCVNLQQPAKRPPNTWSSNYSPLRTWYPRHRHINKMTLTEWQRILSRIYENEDENIRKYSATHLPKMLPIPNASRCRNAGWKSKT